MSEADLQRSEVISLPLAALALLVVFGSVVAAGVPLVVGGTAVVVALAAIFLVASVMPMSIFVLNLATLLGLGLGVDYSLLLTSRFREELALRPPGPTRVADAVRVTVATAGRAVFFSGLTVLLGLLGLILFEFMILRSVGIAGAIVVGLAVASALTLLPAVLMLVGDRIDRFAIRRVRAGADADGPWARLARRVMRHPVAVLIPTLAFLLLLGSPFLHIRFNAPDASILPPEVPSRAAFDRLRAQFGEGEFAPAGRGDPDARPRDRAGPAGRPLRLFAPAGGRSAGHAGGGPRRCRPSAHARPVRAALRGPERPARPVPRAGARGHDERRRDRVHALHAVRPEPRRGQGARGRPARPDGRRWRHRPAPSSSSAAGPRT